MMQFAPHVDLRSPPRGGEKDLEKKERKKKEKKKFNVAQTHEGTSEIKFHILAEQNS